MKKAAVIAASVAVASAQVTYNSTSNTWTCAKPGQVYCAGSSLGTDIIIRCDASGNGQPGRCSDNLAGEPPMGVSPALCFQTSETSGDAACEKNCVIYGGSGNFPGTSTLPSSVCTPFYTASSTASATATGGGGSGSGSGSVSVSVSVSTKASGTGNTLVTVTSSCLTPSGTGGASSGISIPSNGTVTIIPPPSSGGNNGNPTKTPVGPTSVNPTKTGGNTALPTAGASANRVGGALAALGLAAAYLL